MRSPQCRKSRPPLLCCSQDHPPDPRAHPKLYLGLSQLPSASQLSTQRCPALNTPPYISPRPAPSHPPLLPNLPISQIPPTNKTSHHLHGLASRKSKVTSILAPPQFSKQQTSICTVQTAPSAARRAMAQRLAVRAVRCVASSPSPPFFCLSHPLDVSCSAFCDCYFSSFVYGWELICAIVLPQLSPPNGASSKHLMLLGIGT